MKKINLTTEKFEVYKKCLRDGMKLKAIAEKLNIPCKTLYYYRDLYLSESLTQEEIEELKNYIKQKTTRMSFPAIARRFNISKKTLHYYLKSLAEKDPLDGSLFIRIGEGGWVNYPKLNKTKEI